MSTALTSGMRRALKTMGLEVRRTPAPGPQMRSVDIARLLYFSRMLSLVADIEGDVVECGVGRGQSLLMLTCLVKEEMRGRKVWGFDSFEGFPEPSAQDQSVRNPKAGEWGETSLRAVEQLLLQSGLERPFVRSQVTLVQGFLEQTLSKHAGAPIALLHLDVDLYASYQTALTALYPRLAPGGVVLFDEYMGTIEHLHFPGAQQAIDEFLGDRKANVRRDRATGKYYYIKPKEDRS